MANNTNMATFIPEIWADEVVGAYKANLVAANIVRNINHAGKKGDTINIPAPGRGTAVTKAAGVASAVNDFSSNQSGNIAVGINDHFQYSVRIDDITSLQAMNSMRRFYTDDAGFALAAKVDETIITALDGASALTGGNSVITVTTDWDEKLLEAIEALNNNNVPSAGRSLIVTPSCMTALMKEERFTEQQFIGNGDAIATGKIGQIYGVDVYVSTQVGATATEKAFLLQTEAVVLATQQGVRVQTQYQQEYLADLMTADSVFGVAVARPGSIVELST